MFAATEQGICKAIAMRTLTCQFAFPDGATATARATAEAPQDDVPVFYTGAFARFPQRFYVCDLSTVRIWAARVAKESSVHLVITETGQYDAWAE